MTYYIAQETLLKILTIYMKKESKTEWIYVYV